MSKTFEEYDGPKELLWDQEAQKFVYWIGYNGSPTDYGDVTVTVHGYTFQGSLEEVTKRIEGLSK